jgi:RNA polymerase sigma-70 factor, ECF subfamily
VFAPRMTQAEVRQCYERFSPVVYRRALRMLGRDADAWDVVQEVFRQLLQSGAAFRGEARPITYLYRITTNLCLNHLRGREVRGEGRAAQSRQPSVEHAGPEPGLSEARELLMKLAASLDDRSARVAVLHFMDGLTQDEIGKVLGMSRKTVGRVLERIRRSAAVLGGLQIEEAPHG